MKEFNSQSGKSVIELIIVLVVVMIIITAAVYQSGRSKEHFTRQNLAREFKVYLERARFDSVKRRPSSSNIDDQSRIVIKNATSYEAFLDLNQNGVIDSTDKRIINLANSNVKFVGNNLAFPITISFDRRGKITVTNSVSATSSIGSFTLCQNCTISTANSTNASTISISPSGTVAMLPGVQTLSVAQQPTVTTDTSSVHNPLIKVN
ncbi:MAG TPA: GspH/FimT family pseudopilin [Pyrinomonadaceae bacterium]|nr:GspH/FimT family pseudopilin [Pyrinomonadaceae bacterium]